MIKRVRKKKKKKKKKKRIMPSNLATRFPSTFHVDMHQGKQEALKPLLLPKSRYVADK